MERVESAGNRFGRIAFLLLGVIFSICLLVQIFLAGAAIFVDPFNWSRHSLFIKFFGFYVPFLMLIMSFVGRLPSWGYKYSISLIVLIWAMYFTANMTPISPWLGATHPVIGVSLLVLSFILFVKTWRLLTK